MCEEEGDGGGLVTVSLDLDDDKLNVGSKAFFIVGLF